jgi:hypothetical protein
VTLLYYLLTCMLHYGAGSNYIWVPQQQQAATQDAERQASAQGPAQPQVVPAAYIKQQWHHTQQPTFPHPVPLLHPCVSPPPEVHRPECGTFAFSHLEAKQVIHTRPGTCIARTCLISDSVD